MEKIIQMEKVLERTFFVSCDEINIVSSLLNDFWKRKDGGLIFFKKRNTFNIEVSGENHPLWKVKVIPTSEYFNEYDWKLRQDINKLLNIDKKKNKYLYLNDENVKVIKILTEILIKKGYMVVYSDDYILFREKDKIKIFKIAAKNNIKVKKDGWYIGEKKIGG